MHENKHDTQMNGHLHMLVRQKKCQSKLDQHVGLICWPTCYPVFAGLYFTTLYVIYIEPFLIPIVSRLIETTSYPTSHLESRFVIRVDLKHVLLMKRSISSQIVFQCVGILRGRYPYLASLGPV